MKIIGVLLNPTIDKIYEIENFDVEGTFKVKRKEVFPVGKAISFALGVRTLTDRNDLVHVIAFIGYDDTLAYTNFLESKKINRDFIRIRGKTRSNITINDPIRKTTTHIREEGFSVEDEEDVQKFVKKIVKKVGKGDIVVFSGSTPPNIDRYIYNNLIKICKKNKAITVLDSSGIPLISGVTANPHIIKPNLTELAQILQKPDLNKINRLNIPEACNILTREARPLLNNELKIILITLGDKGAICLTKNIALYGDVKVEKVKDTVGSGDAFLAGFVYNYAQEKSIEECFRYAIACGAANTKISGPGIFSLDDVVAISKKIKIIEI